MMRRRRRRKRRHLAPSSWPGLAAGLGSAWRAGADPPSASLPARHPHRTAPRSLTHSRAEAADHVAVCRTCSISSLGTCWRGGAENERDRLSHRSSITAEPSWSAPHMEYLPLILKNNNYDLQRVFVFVRWMGFEEGFFKRWMLCISIFLERERERQR